MVYDRHGGHFVFFDFSLAYEMLRVRIYHRMLLFFAEYAFLKGSFHNLLYFVPMRCEIILFWVVLLLGLVFLFANGKLFLCAMQYSYPFTLYTADTKLKLIGYLDSGNLATYHQIPIIF